MLTIFSEKPLCGIYPNSFQLGSKWTMLSHSPMCVGSIQNCQNDSFETPHSPVCGGAIEDKMRWGIATSFPVCVGLLQSGSFWALPFRHSPVCVGLLPQLVTFCYRLRTFSRVCGYSLAFSEGIPSRSFPRVCEAIAMKGTIEYSTLISPVFVLFSGAVYRIYSRCFCADSSEAIRTLDDDERGSLRISEGTSKLGGNPNMNIISEAGLYTLLIRSNKPA